jgi:NAD(P)-dependent dehydrogenase (short-subunit alcohol dehydrogenase family)
MRIVITGGTGLIGRALAAELAGDGHERLLELGLEFRFPKAEAVLIGLLAS